MPLKIIEEICKFFYDLTGREFRGKAILLRIDDTNHPDLMNTIVNGVIYDIKLDVIVNKLGDSRHLDGSFAIIHIDSSMNFNGRNIEWLMVVPRHKGYGFYRLYCTWIAVYIYVLESSTPSQDLSWNDIVAICSMKLAR